MIKSVTPDNVQQASGASQSALASAMQRAQASKESSPKQVSDPGSISKAGDVPVEASAVRKHAPSPTEGMVEAAHKMAAEAKPPQSQPVDKALASADELITSGKAKNQAKEDIVQVAEELKFLRGRVDEGLMQISQGRERIEEGLNRMSQERERIEDISESVRKSELEIRRVAENVEQSDNARKADVRLTRTIQILGVLGVIVSGASMYFTSNRLAKDSKEKYDKLLNRQYVRDTSNEGTSYESTTPERT